MRWLDLERKLHINIASSHSILFSPHPAYPPAPTLGHVDLQTFVTKLQDFNEVAATEPVI